MSMYCICIIDNYYPNVAKFVGIYADEESAQNHLNTVALLCPQYEDSLAYVFVPGEDVASILKSDAYC